MVLKKTKSKTNTSTELHFISSLQLEESVRMIANIADEKHQVTLTEMGPDEFKFHIDYLPNRSKQAEIKGTLLRWNGTETKIDADGDVFRLDKKDMEQNGAMALASSVALAFLGSGVAIAAGQSWLMAPIILGAMGMGYYGFNANEQKNTPTVFFRHRDYLLQRLIDTFKAAGDVEAV